MLQQHNIEECQALVMRVERKFDKRYGLRLVRPLLSPAALTGPPGNYREDHFL